MDTQSIASSASFKIRHHGLVLGLMDQDDLEALINEKLMSTVTDVQLHYGRLIKLMILRFASGDMPHGINDMESFACSLPANMFSTADNADDCPYSQVTRDAFCEVLDRIGDYGPARFYCNTVSDLIDHDAVTSASLTSSSLYFHGFSNSELTEISRYKQPASAISAYCDDSENAVEAPVTFDTDNAPALSEVELMEIWARMPGSGQSMMLFQSPLYDSKSDKSQSQSQSHESAMDEALRACKEQFPNLSRLVVDSAAITAAIVKACKDNGTDLVTRLPDSRVKKDFEQLRNGSISLTITSAATYQSAPEGTGGQAFSYAWLGHHDLKCRDGSKVTLQKILFVDEAMRALTQEAVLKKAEKELIQVNKKLAKLQSEPRSGNDDATKAFQEIIKKLKLVSVTEPEFEEPAGDPARRKAADRYTAGARSGATAGAVACISEAAVKEAVENELCHVIATADTEAELTPERALELYLTCHSQSDMESQWQDFKGMETFFDAPYLVSRKRIMALAAVMSIALYYVRKVLTAVRKVLDEHRLSIGLKNTPDCQRPLWKTFLKFACGETEDTRITISPDAVQTPYLFDSSIIGLTAREIGDEALRYYSAEFYENQSALICSFIQQHMANIRVQRGLMF